MTTEQLALLDEIKKKVDWLESTIRARMIENTVNGKLSNALLHATELGSIIVVRATLDTIG